MATFTEYEAVGLKEDISDVITNISPTKTPFQSAIGSEKVTQKYYQWQEDSLRATATNAQTEGFTASSVTVTPTVMRANYTQILAETVAVSGSMDAASTYGRARETAYQMAKSAAQVKRDLEYHMVGVDTQATAGDNSGPVARKFASYSRLLTVSGNVVYPGSGNTVSEDNLLTALQNCWTNGAEPNTVSVTAANSLTVANFAKASGRFRTINDSSGQTGKVVNAVDIYVSPFGEVKIVLNRFQKSTWTLVYDASMWKKAVFRNWFREVLAKTGDASTQMIVGEFGLIHKNFLASSLIVDGATSGF